MNVCRKVSVEIGIDARGLVYVPTKGNMAFDLLMVHG